MAASKELVRKRHNEVRKAFRRMSDEKKYKYEFIIQKLATDYHYRKGTVEKIICSEDTDDNNSNQPKLF